MGQWSLGMSCHSIKGRSNGGGLRMKQALKYLWHIATSRRWRVLIKGRAICFRRDGAFKCAVMAGEDAKRKRRLGFCRSQEPVEVWIFIQEARYVNEAQQKFGR